MIKLNISYWPFIVASLRHTCAIIMLSNQHLDMSHLWGGMDYLGKGEVLTNTDLDRCVNIIWQKWSFVYIENVLDLWVQLMEKWEQKQKCCVYIFVQCTLYYLHIIHEVYILAACGTVLSPIAHMIWPFGEICKTYRKNTWDYLPSDHHDLK